MLMVKYIPSAENYADVMTKNVTDAIYKRLVPDIRNGTFGKLSTEF